MRRRRAARGGGIRVLVASDGSPLARAAARAATRGPWPPGSRAAGVVASAVSLGPEWSPQALTALDEGAERAARELERDLRRHWRAARATVVRQPATAAILARARTERAQVIVVGSRGAGGLGRLLLGSVSRAVARDAPCSVLVVKGRLAFRRLVLGIDGSASARRAVALVARLTPRRGSRVTVVQAVEPLSVPSLRLLPGTIRGTLRAEAAAVEREALSRARRAVERAVTLLRGKGWRVDAVVRHGAPVPELLAAVELAGADLVVLGSRGMGGVGRLLLGSVAEGILSQGRTSTLIVR